MIDQPDRLAELIVDFARPDASSAAIDALGQPPSG